MHHFFVETDAIAGGSVVLSGDEAHHAARVLRVRVGEAITVADGTGRVVEAVVSLVDGIVEADIRDVRSTDVIRPVLTLYQAVTKGDKMDSIVEKAVEVGVRRIVPFIAERTIVSWDAKKRAARTERWTAIARAAAKQSRSPWLPRVDEVVDEIEVPSGELGIVLHEAAPTMLRDRLPEVAPEAIGIVVGPEGGFTDDEVEALTTRGAVAAGLGDRILRTETAGPAVAAIVAYTYGSLG